MNDDIGDIPCNNCGVKYSHYQQLKEENKSLNEQVNASLELIEVLREHVPGVDLAIDKLNKNIERNKANDR